MTVPFYYHPEARKEALHAIRYYASASPRLGEDFLAALESAISLLVERPMLGPADEGSARRKLLRRFPYTLIYRLRDGGIQILAVMHQRQKPGYWLNRVR